MSSNEENKSDSRSVIIAVATQLFAKLGLDKCSTREIAKQSDTNISLISYYFGGKEGLYKEVMRSYAEQIKSKAQPIVDEIQKSDISKEQFMQEMKNIISHIVMTRIEGPEMSKIFSREKLAGLPYSKEIHEDVFYPLIQNFYKLIEKGKQNGFVNSETNPAFLFIMITEGIWGFFEIIECNTRLAKDAEHLAKDAELLIQQNLNLILKGVLI